MSFSTDVKRELLLTADKCTAACCSHAQCYGLIVPTRCFSPAPRTFTTENVAVARKIAECVAQQAGVMAELSTRLSRQEKTACTFSIPGEAQREQLLNVFGYTGRETTLRLNLANMENPCCAAAFLRGVFLSCGYVADPQKAYHWEISLPYKKLAEDIAVFLSHLEEVVLEPAYCYRKGQYVVYSKDSEKIEDLLTLLGAPNGAMAYMQTKILKDVRNNINRKVNFETANLDKTALASAKQTAALQKIEQTVGLQALPDDLKELAYLRLENPEMSLRTLSEALSLTRSGVNHRLQRILAFAEQL